MAEFIFQHLAEQAGVSDRFEVSSAAVSTEEIGNDIYPPAKNVLYKHNVPFTNHSARQISRHDCTYYDYIICMDKSNIRRLSYLTDNIDNNKVSMLLSWAGIDRDVADPWYTDNVEAAYRDIYVGCEALLNKLLENN